MPGAPGLRATPPCAGPCGGAASASVGAGVSKAATPPWSAAPRAGEADVTPETDPDYVLLLGGDGPGAALTRDFLLRAGWPCEVARSVREAEAVVGRRGAPAVLVTERRIGAAAGAEAVAGPNDGDAFAARLAARAPETGIVFATRHGAAGLRLANNHRAVPEPCPGARLLDAVRGVARR